MVVVDSCPAEINPLVSVIILNFNGAQLLEECLFSVLKTHYAPVEIIVVDNHSTDSSLDILSTFPAVRCIRNSQNYGYAEGNNIGIEKSLGKYAVTLNNDMTVDPRWLDEPVRMLETNPSIGIISCRQMSYYDRNMIDGLYHTIKSDLTFLPFGHGRPLQENPHFLQSGFVISANGGSAILRKSMIMEIGGFDSRFFAYLDETDLCMRAFLQGWNCLYLPEAVVYHKGSASFRKAGALHYYYRERNRIWFLYKFFPLHYLIKHLVFLLIMEIRVIRVLCLKLKKPSLYLKARFDALARLSIFYADRKKNIPLIKRCWSRFLQMKKKRIIPLSG